MSIARLRSLLLAALVSTVLPGVADGRARDERWRAASTTAMGITGDIVLSPTRLRMAGREIPLRVAADLPDYESMIDARVAARVLEVTRALDPVLLHGNRWGCGKGRPVRWIVV